MARPPSTNDATRDAIIEFVLSNFISPYTRETIPLDESLVELDVIDSYGVVELVAFLEDNWSITIDDEEITRETMGSVNKMVHLLQWKLGASEAAVAVG